MIGRDLRRSWFIRLVGWCILTLSYITESFHQERWAGMGVKTLHQPRQLYQTMNMIKVSSHICMLRLYAYWLQNMHTCFPDSWLNKESKAELINTWISLMHTTLLWNHLQGNAQSQQIGKEINLKILGNNQIKGSKF